MSPGRPDTEPGVAWPRRLWTIGHSTRSGEEFVAVLRAHKIEAVVDVRLHPGSKRYPHFNSEALATLLTAQHIAYLPLRALGGRRRPRPDSRNTAWRNESFRGYADYMETPEFEAAARALAERAGVMPTAVMCAEAVWWRCHRGLIADYFKARGTEVCHLFDLRKSEPHPFTGAARLVDGRLDYTGEETLF